MKHEISQRWPLLCSLFICGLIGWSSHAHACKVPVFRYALEQWHPDPYQLVILHRGPLSQQDKARVISLKTRLGVEIAIEFEKPIENEVVPPSFEATKKTINTPTHPKSGANLRVLQIDVGASDEHPELVDALGTNYREGVTSPQLILLYPPGSEVHPLVWRGAFTDANINAIVHSPARNRITQLILDGESVVWVLIGIGDKAKDDAAMATLRAELPRLEKTLKMRDVDVIKAQKEFGNAASVKLKLAFELITVDRNDPAETVFLSMLLRSELDLESIKEPILIPVFGRGRTYYAMAGRGIHPNILEATSRFLIEDCSCEIKRLNPGMDLLFNVKWATLIDGRVEVEDPLASVHGAIPAEDVNNQIQLADGPANGDATGNTATGESPGKQLLFLVLGMLAVALVMALITASRLRKQA